MLYYEIKKTADRPTDSTMPSPFTQFAYQQPEETDVQIPEPTDQEPDQPPERESETTTPEVAAIDTDLAARTGGSTRQAPTQQPTRNTRARIDASVLPSSEQTSVSPLKYALDYVESHTESLHKGIATLLLERASQYLTSWHKLSNKRKQIKRLEEDDALIPSSARINFRLNPLKDVEESPELTTLTDEIRAAVTTFQLLLKSKIIACAKIEAASMLKSSNEIYCKSILDIVTMFRTAQGLASTPASIIRTIFDTDHAALLQHTALTKAQFYALFSEVTGVLLENDANAHNGHNTGEIKRIIEAIFVTTKSRYAAKQKSNELSTTLKKLAKETLTNDKTAEADMIVDQELPVNREQLQELIRKQAEALAKTLVKEEVAKQLKQSKNYTRGPAGASTKKKNGKHKNHPSPNSNGRPTNDKGQGRKNAKNKHKAGENDNASTAGRSTKTTQRKARSNSKSRKTRKGRSNQRQQS